MSSDADDAREFVVANFASLARLSFALTGDQHDASDLLQDTIERLVRKWPRGGPSQPWSYSKTVMVRLNVDRFRRLRREVLSWNVPEQSYEPVLFTELEPEVVAAMRSLTPQQRSAMAFRYLEGLEMDEIAELLNCSSATVRSHLSHATRRMRHMIATPKSRAEAKSHD